MFAGVAATALAGLAGTKAGAVLVVEMARRALDQRLSVDSVSGCILGRMELAGLVYRDSAAGIDARLGRATIEISPGAILRGRIELSNVEATGLSVRLAASSNVSRTQSALSLPIVVELKRLVLVRGELLRAGRIVQSISTIELAGRWSGEQISVQRLKVTAASGELSLAGELQTHEPFIRRAMGRVQWRLFDRLWAGAVTAVNGRDGVSMRAAVANPVAAEISGTVRFAGPEWELNLNVPKVDVRAFAPNSVIRALAADLQARSNGGSIELRGQLGVDDVPIDIELARARFRSGTVELKVLGHAPERRGSFDISAAIGAGGKRIDVEHVDVRSGAGRFAARGQLQLEPRMRWQATAEATRFDPSVFIPGWPAAIDLDLMSAGEIASNGPRMSVQLRRLSGTLRGRRISGKGSLQVSPDMRAEGALRVSVGKAHAAIVAERGATLNLRADVNIPALAEWQPSLAGAITARLHSRGRWPNMAIDTQLQARGFRSTVFSTAHASVDLTLRDVMKPAGRLTVVARDVATAGFVFTSAQLEVDGVESAHTVHLRATGDKLAGALTASGSYARRGWAATLQSVTIDARDIPPLTLQAPVSIEIAPDRVALSKSCLAGVEISLCFAIRGARDGTAEGFYEVHELPLGLIVQAAAVDETVVLDGRLAGSGSLERLANGELRGAVRLGSRSGSLEYRAGPARSLHYRDLRFTADFNGNEARGRIDAQLVERGHVTAGVSVTNLRDNDPALSGSGNIRLETFDPIATLVPQLATLRGRADIELLVAGTVRQPEITARVNASEIETEVPVLGLKLRDGRLAIRTQRTAVLDLSAALASGKGVIAVSGAGDEKSGLRLHIQGQDFVAADIPGAFVEIAPDLRILTMPDDIAVEGAITVTRADIDLEALVTGAGRQSSADVTVVDREQPEPGVDARLSANISVAFGERVSIRGFGLDGTVSGRLRIRDYAGAETTAVGEVNLAGSYELYGRKLSMERARLMFAGTPLGDPQLDIVASRELPELTIKVHITGTARRPQLAIVGDGGMTHTEALSYLITGKPPDELRQEEGSVVQSARQSLGTMFAERLTARLTSRLGIDDVGIQHSVELGGSALTIGKYLSPRFFVSYGIALFQPGRVVTLRYEISDRWSIEANQSPDQHQAGIEYRLER